MRRPGKGLQRGGHSRDGKPNAVVSLGWVVSHLSCPSSAAERPCFLQRAAQKGQIRPPARPLTFEFSFPAQTAECAAATRDGCWLTPCIQARDARTVPGPFARAGGDVGSLCQRESMRSCSQRRLKASPHAGGPAAPGPSAEPPSSPVKCRCGPTLTSASSSCFTGSLQSEVGERPLPAASQDGNARDEVTSQVDCAETPNLGSKSSIACFLPAQH